MPWWWQIRDKVRQYLGRQPFDPLEILGSPIDVRIDGTDIHEYAVSKFTRKFSPHPLQRITAAATARAHHKHRGMTVRIERRRISNFGICDPAQRLVCRADLSSDERIMRVVEQAEGDHYAGDKHGHPAAFGEFLDQCDKENAAGHQEP